MYIDQLALKHPFFFFPLKFKYTLNQINHLSLGGDVLLENTL